MKTHPHSCPRLCIAAVVGVLFGLSALVVAWKMVEQLPRPFTTAQSVKQHLLIQGSGWHFPTASVPVTVSSAPATLLFVGDIMLDRNVATRSRLAHDLSYPFKRLPLGWFDQADEAVANLEGPVTDKRRPPEKTIDFQFDPAVIDVLKKQGIDAFSQANNHTLDQGRIGADDSRARLKAAGFLVFGDEVNDNDVAVATTTIRGQRFAFVGFNTTNNPLDERDASSTLAKAHALADHVFVFMHWGLEYRDRAPQQVIDEAHWLIDHGADIVIGGHPHWVQGLDMYKGHPIVYSLGNFIFDQDFSKETREGLALKLTIDGSRVSIEPIPMQIDRSQPHVVEGGERIRRLTHLAEISDPSLREQIQRGKVDVTLP